jgi:hypothetical protein
MADNYLEKHMEEYEARKKAWLQKKHKVTPKLPKPDDEAL